MAMLKELPNNKKVLHKEQEHGFKFGFHQHTHGDLGIFGPTGSQFYGSLNGEEDNARDLGLLKVQCELPWA